MHPSNDTIKDSFNIFPKAVNYPIFNENVFKN